MRLAVALVFFAAVHGEVLDVPDFEHYRLQNPHTHKQEGDFFNVDIYDSTGKPGWYDMTLKPPSLLRFKVPCGSAFPPSRTKFWLDGEVLYVVTRGTATITTRNNTKEVIKRGGAFYSAAGLWHGPVENTGKGELVVMVLADFNPHFDNPPAILPKEDADSPGQKAFNPNPKGYVPYSAVNPDGAAYDCLSVQPFDGTGLIVAPLAVEMTPDCVFPEHYHPTGAFYFFTHGRLLISGDGNDAVTFLPGDGRWSRPGWKYGPEHSLDATVRFIVLGVPPALEPAPNHIDLVTRKVETVQVTYKNTQFVDESSGAALVTTKKRRVRTHLRSKVVEGEESVFLQQPLEEFLVEEL